MILSVCERRHIQNSYDYTSKYKYYVYQIYHKDSVRIFMLYMGVVYFVLEVSFLNKNDILLYRIQLLLS